MAVLFLLANAAASMFAEAGCPITVEAFKLAAEEQLGRSVHIDERLTMGRDEVSSRRITALAVAGEKRATVARLAEFSERGRTVPNVGRVILVVDPRGCPNFVYRVAAVQILPFGAMTTLHLSAESPALRDLATWRNAHLQMWRPAISGLSPSDVEKLPVVWQRFDLLYPRAQ